MDDLLSDDSTPSEPAESASSDDRLVAEALADQEHILALCLAVRARHKAARKILGPLIEHHRTHVRVLGGDPSSRQVRSGVSGSQKESLAALQREERAAAKRRSRDARRADAGELARVLASIAASQLQHESVLDGSTGGGV